MVLGRELDDDDDDNDGDSDDDDDNDNCIGNLSPFLCCKLSPEFLSFPLRAVLL